MARARRRLTTPSPPLSNAPGLTATARFALQGPWCVPASILSPYAETARQWDDILPGATALTFQAWRRKGLGATRLVITEEMPDAIFALHASSLPVPVWLVNRHIPEALLRGGKHLPRPDLLSA